MMEVLSRFAAIERASIDEAYLDLTGSARERLRELRGRPLEAELLPTTFVQGLPAEPGLQPADKGTRASAPMAPRGSRCRAGASRGAAVASRAVPSRCAGSAAGAEGGALHPPANGAPPAAAACSRIAPKPSASFLAVGVRSRM